MIVHDTFADCKLIKRLNANNRELVGLNDVKSSNKRASKRPTTTRCSFFMDILCTCIMTCISPKRASIYSDPQCLPIERRNHIMTGPHLSQDSHDPTSLQSIVANSRALYAQCQASVVN